MGWGQILTLKNYPTCFSAPRVFIRYKLHWDGLMSNVNVRILTLHVVLLHVHFQYTCINFNRMEWGQILTLKNDPTCSLAHRVVLKYKLHRDGVGFKF